MSLCVTCMSPGACCRRMFISGGSPDARTGKRIGEPMSYEAAERIALEFNLPFVPADNDDESGAWSYTCSALGSDGRCGIYEDRPQLCRDFRPGSSPLCVHYWVEDEVA